MAVSLGPPMDSSGPASGPRDPRVYSTVALRRETREAKADAPNNCAWPESVEAEPTEPLVKKDDRLLLPCSVRSILSGLFANEVSFYRLLYDKVRGIKFISKHREQRIKSIAHHLNEQDYDFVFLQEVWCQQDYEYLRSNTPYAFAHVFKNSSIIGTSGLVVLSKWIPSVVHFEPFLVNGSPFRPLHGDWFAGKGVGYILIKLNGLRLHLFCTHTHAQYHEEEQIDHQYHVHRICQSYQLAKFVNLISSSVSFCKEGKDLLILAGDLNTKSNTLPFRLLLSMTGLVDSCKYRYMDIVCSKEEQPEDSEAGEDDDLITCGHHKNTFTKKKKENLINEMIMKSSGNRIDFILYKLVGTPQELKESSTCVSTSDFEAVANRISCHGKDPVTGISFSDHQPVIVSLKINSKSQKSSMKSLVLSPKFGPTRDPLNPRGSRSTEYTAGASAASRVLIPPELKVIAAESVAKLPGARNGTNTNVIEAVDQLYLTKCNQLMKGYLESNFLAKQRTLLTILLVVLLLLSLNVVAIYTWEMATSTFVLLLVTILGLGVVLVIVTSLTHVYEQTAITGISEEIDCLLALRAKECSFP